MFTYADVSYILKFLHKPLLCSNSKVSAELFLVHVMMPLDHTLVPDPLSFPESK